MAKRALRAHNAAAVRETLVKIANEVRAGDLMPAQANAITACMNAILSSIRIDEQEAKIMQFEQIMLEIRRDR